MQLVYQKPNPSGAYPPIQESNFSSVPEGMAVWPDNLPTEDFYAYNGFVTLTVEQVETVIGREIVTIPAAEEGGEPTIEPRDVTTMIPTVTACIPNVEAWEAWKAGLPEPGGPGQTEPTIWDQMAAAIQEGVNEV